MILGVFDVQCVYFLKFTNVCALRAIQLAVHAMHVALILNISTDYVDCNSRCVYVAVCCSVGDAKICARCAPYNLLQPMADRVAQNLAITSRTLSTYQNSAHGIYDEVPGINMSVIINSMRILVLGGADP